MSPEDVEQQQRIAEGVNREIEEFGFESTQAFSEEELQKRQL